MFINQNCEKIFCADEVKVVSLQSDKIRLTATNVNEHRDMKNDIEIIPNDAELEQQFEYVHTLIEQHRSMAIAKVNTEAILTNWEVAKLCSCQLHN